MDASLELATTTIPATVDEAGVIQPIDLEALAGKNPDSEKRRYAWWFVVWPESCNISKLFQILNDSKLAIAVSPLHDKDTKDDGDPDKPHYHIIVRFPNARRMNTVRELVGKWLFMADGFSKVAEVGDVTWYVRPIDDFNTAIRYLCHLDTPTKYRYPVNEVLTFGFIDVSMLYAKSIADDVHAYAQLLAWVRANPTRSYSDLTDAVFESNDMVLLRALTRYSYTLKAYISSKRRQFLDAREEDLRHSSDDSIFD